MKHLNATLWACGLAVAAANADAALVETFTFDNLNKSIPDNSLAGVTDSHSIASSITDIGSVTVDLNIGGLSSSEPAYNGDLYVYLSHGSGLAVLLNRTGRTATDSLGYPDNGFNVTFSDAAANGDIHPYRLTLFGNNTTPVDPNYINPLTGTWAPDGRNVSPQNVLDTTARTALLAAFEGLDANGQWSLFLADASPGGTAQLNSWSLEIAAVPESTAAGVFAGVLCVLAVIGRDLRVHRRKTPGQAS